MKEMQIPTLKDVHVHSRMSMEHKETMETLSQAAIAGGYDKLWLMPNDLPVVDEESVDKKLREFRRTFVNYAVFVGATSTNFDKHKEVFDKVCGLKIYMNATTGDLLVDDPEVLEQHFKNWPKGKPICVHAEMEKLDIAIKLSQKHDQHLHVCHVSREYEVDLIRRAKESGLKITCEVSPNHLFMTEEDGVALGDFARMNPTLGTKKDQEVLWKAVQSGIIDMVATDHAPHTREEKLNDLRSFGTPGLETTLPLLLTAVVEKRITFKDVVRITSTNSSNIFGIGSNNYVVVDLERKWVIPEDGFQTKCDWSPFSGMDVQGKIKRVIFDNKEVFNEEGSVNDRI